MLGAEVEAAMEKKEQRSGWKETQSEPLISKYLFRSLITSLVFLIIVLVHKIINSQPILVKLHFMLKKNSEESKV